MRIVHAHPVSALQASPILAGLGPLRTQPGTIEVNVDYVVSAEFRDAEGAKSYGFLLALTDGRHAWCPAADWYFATRTPRPPLTFGGPNGLPARARAIGEARLARVLEQHTGERRAAAFRQHESRRARG